MHWAQAFSKKGAYYVNSNGEIRPTSNNNKRRLHATVVATAPTRIFAAPSTMPTMTTAAVATMTTKATTTATTMTVDTDDNVLVSLEGAVAAGTTRRCPPRSIHHQQQDSTTEYPSPSLAVVGKTARYITPTSPTMTRDTTTRKSPCATATTTTPLLEEVVDPSLDTDDNVLVSLEGAVAAGTTRRCPRRSIHHQQQDSTTEYSSPSLAVVGKTAMSITPTRPTKTRDTTTTRKSPCVTATTTTPLLEQVVDPSVDTDGNALVSLEGAVAAGATRRCPPRFMHHQQQDYTTEYSSPSLAVVGKTAMSITPTSPTMTRDTTSPCATATTTTPLLEQVAGPSKEKVWWETFQKVKKFYIENGHLFYIENGHLNFPRSTPEENRLRLWLLTQCENSKSLRKDRLELLESIKYMTMIAKNPYMEAQWQSHFDKLVEYKRIHGNTNVPQRYKKDPSLGRWVSTQRFYFAIMKLDRIKKLNSIRFEWST